MTAGPVYPDPRDEADAPLWAVRRRTDRCFFAAEEVVTGPTGELVGYIVEGILWSSDDIAEVRPLTPGSTCDTG